MTELELRAAHSGDGETIARIQLAAWRDTYGQLNPEMVSGLDLTRTADNWARAAKDPAYRLVLAEQNGKVLGYAHSGPAEGQEPVGELFAVYLLPSAQGIGAGRLLAEDALAGLASAGYDECILWVVEENPHARGFYEHLGFRADNGRDTWRSLPVLRYRRPTLLIAR